MVGISGLVADKNYRKITDPDVVAMLQDLKMLPDNVLMEYAQNPNDPKKQTNALVVLNSRKIAKEQQTDSPQATVKDDVISNISEPPKVLVASASNEDASQGIGASSPTPQQLLRAGGVARLPSNVGNYAGGGIVAFQDGGDVAFPQRYSQMYPSFDVLKGGLAGMASYLNPYSYSDKLVRDPVTGKLILAPKEDRFKTMKDKMEEELMEARLERQMDKKSIAQKQEELVTNPPGVVDSKLAAYEGITDQDIEDVARITRESLVKKEPTRGETQGEVFNTNVVSLEDMIAGEIKTPEDIIAGEIKTPDSRANTSTDIENILAENKTEAKKIAGSLGADLDTLKDKRTLDKFAEEVKSNYAKLGVDSKMFDLARDDIRSQKDMLKGEIGKAADMALIEAGLLIAGGESSNALSNVAKAVPAIKNYTNTLSNLRGEERELAKFDFTITSADAAMKSGMADKALALYSKAQDNIADIDKSKLTALKQIELDGLKLRSQTNIDQILTEAKIKAQYDLQDKRGETAIKVAEIGSAGRGTANLLAQAKLRQDFGKLYDGLNLKGDDSVKNKSREQYIEEQMAAVLTSPTLTASSTSGQIFEFDPSAYK